MPAVGAQQSFAPQESVGCFGLLMALIVSRRFKNPELAEFGSENCPHEMGLARTVVSSAIHPRQLPLEREAARLQQFTSQCRQGNTVHEYEVAR